MTVVLSPAEQDGELSRIVALPPPSEAFQWLTCHCDNTIPSAVMITPEA
jgi:hypothetical protein